MVLSELSTAPARAERLLSAVTGSFFSVTAPKATAVMANANRRWSVNLMLVSIEVQNRGELELCESIDAGQGEV